MQREGEVKDARHLCKDTNSFFKREINESLNIFIEQGSGCLDTQVECLSFDSVHDDLFSLGNPVFFLDDVKSSSSGLLNTV